MRITEFRAENFEKLMNIIDLQSARDDRTSVLCTENES